MDVYHPEDSIKIILQHIVSKIEISGNDPLYSQHW